MTKSDIVYAVSIVFRVMDAAIFIHILLSWVPSLRNTAFGRLVSMIVEPVLSPIRSLIYKSPLGGAGMPLDFSPLIAYLLLEVLYQIVVGLIASA